MANQNNEIIIENKHLVEIEVNEIPAAIYSNCCGLMHSVGE